MRVEIRGVVYLTVKVAAETLGVATNTIYSALAHNTLSGVGLGQGKRPQRNNGGRKRKPFTIGSTTFASMADASRALGQNPHYVQQVCRRGGLRGQYNLVVKMMKYTVEQDKAAIATKEQDNAQQI